MTVHIDNEQLAELKEVLEDEFSVLIDTYLTDAKLRLNLIKNGIATQDYEAVRLAAHSLKGRVLIWARCYWRSYVSV
ncbi:MAG: Hpt domain-containing protein [Moraxellaceae bacterium]|nr:Hpt domain-containing protein [Moraxellaceae bacterium]